MKLYQKIVSIMGAYNRCIKTGNKEWATRYHAELKKLEEKLPYGHGLDPRIIISKNPSKGFKLETPFHHLDKNGFYNARTEHIVTVRPSLFFEIELSISGPDRNKVKDYLHQIFYDALMQEVE